MENVYSVGIARAGLLGSLLALGTAPVLAQGPVPPPAGLAGWWSMDRNADDLGPSALHGTLAGAGGAFEPGQVLGAFRAAAPDGHIVVADDPALDVTDNFTFEMWVRQDGFLLDRNYLVNKGTADHRSTPYAFGILGMNGFLPTTPGASMTGFPAPGRPFVVVSDGSMEQVLIANAPVPMGPFTHLAFSVQPVNTGFQARIYMNGVLTAWTWLSRRPFAGAGDLQLGGIPGRQSFLGLVDEVTLYDRALTPAEVQAIFAAGPAGKTKPNLDVTPPMVTITEPADGAVLGSRTLGVIADVSDQSATQVVSTPAGLAANLPPGGGTASGTVSLTDPDGPVLIAVTATDEAGNQAASSVTVVLDTTAPGLTVLNPAEGQVFGASPVTFAIQVDDRTATTLQVGAQSRSLPAGQNAVTVDVPLVEGNNAVAIDVTDAAGNSTRLVRNVVLDQSVPLVTVLSPPDGALFGPGSSGAAVSVRVDDLTATDVASVPAGVAGSLPAGGGLLSGLVPLQEGLNRITVAATDSAGRTGSAAITVNLDTTAPNLAFLAPAAGDAVRGTVEIVASAGEVAPGSGVARIDLFAGPNLLASAAGAELRFDLDTSVLADGDHTLRASAVDGAGNEASALLPLTVDNTAPSVQILSPVAGSVQGTVPFTAVASDTGSGLVSLTMLADGGAPDADGSASFDPPVQSHQADSSVDTAQRPNGPLVLEVEAVDLAGNTATTQVLVEVLNAQPDAPGLKPKDGAVVRKKVKLKVVSEREDLTGLEILVDGQSVASGTSSPLKVRFDTRTRMDGPMEVKAVLRTASGTSETVHTLYVDNMRLRALVPNHLSLDRSRRAPRRVYAILTGPNLELLQPVANHRIELRVHGCSPVPLQAVRELALRKHGKRHHRHLLILAFDRQALVSGLRAARATGALDGNKVKAFLFVDGIEIGSTKLKIREGKRRERDR